MSAYRHTQIATLIIWLISGITLFFTAIMLTTADAPLILWILAPIFLIVLALFHSLSVEVTDDEVKVCFGRGPIRKSIGLREIVSVQAVKNRWYYGWGIRWYPGGWLLNVSGLDAVELILRDGRKYRIGTDEPAALHDAIEDRLSAINS